MYGTKYRANGHRDLHPMLLIFDHAKALLMFYAVNVPNYDISIYQIGKIFTLCGRYKSTKKMKEEAQRQSPF